MYLSLVGLVELFRKGGRSLNVHHVKIAKTLLESEGCALAR